MSPRHPEHLSDFDYRGFYRYSLCFCTIARQEIFITQPVVDLVYEQFLRATHEASFATCNTSPHLTSQNTCL